MSANEREYFFIKTKLNGMVLDVYEANPDPHTKVTTYPQRYNDNRNQLWYIDEATSTLRSLSSGLCLEINDSNRLETNHYKESRKHKQEWVIIEDRICKKCDQDRVLDVVKGNKKAGAEICAWKCHGRANQLWEIEYICADQLNKYFIISQLNGKVLDVCRDGSEPGTEVILHQQRYVSNCNQLWYTGSKQGTLVSASSHLCLDINDKGTLVVNTDKEGDPSQQWVIKGNVICNRNDENKVLEVSVEDRTKICTGTYTEGATNQCWDIENIEGNRAPSVHLRFQDNMPGDIVMIDSLVPREGLAKFTYYCMLNWNCGRNGGGYCGIQDHEKGRNFIFSLWDPDGDSNATEKIRATHTGPGTKVERFGGEGTGLKSWNFTLGWETDEWMTFVAKRWDSQNNKSCYGYWVHKQKSNAWIHLVTMEFPVGGVYFDETSTGCFLEDWMGNGKYPRKAEYKNGFKRCKDGSWFPYSRGKFLAVLEEATSQHNKYYDASVTMDTYSLAMGGKTSQSSNNLNPKGTILNLKNDTPMNEPDNVPIDFEVLTTQENKVEWTLKNGVTPHFSFSVLNKTTGVEVSDVNPSQYQVSMETEAGSEVKVTLEDILGRKRTKSIVVG